MERGSDFVEAERLFFISKQPEDCLTVKKGALMHVLGSSTRQKHKIISEGSSAFNNRQLLSCFFFSRKEEKKRMR